MTNRGFADAVVSMMNDPSAYSRCPVEDLKLISAVLCLIRDGIERELEIRKRKPRLKLVQK